MENVRAFECCGFKFRISDNDVCVEFRNGEVRNFENRREAVIVFVGEICSYIYFTLLQVIEEYGYNRYTGEKEKAAK